MIEQVIFTPEADDDIAESYHWYESREPGLGEDFLRCMEACLHTIQRYPEAFPVAFDDFRHTPIRRFPYEIFYEASDKRIIVHAIFHCSQHPQKWQKRLGHEPE